MSGSEAGPDLVRAQWYDGRSSRGQPVWLRLRQGELELWPAEPEAAAPLQRFPLSRVQPSARLQGVPRRLELPAGQLLETTADDWVDQVLAGRHPLQARVQRLEARTGWAALLGLGAVLAGVLLYQFGLPWLVGRVVERIPWALERELGEQALDLLDTLGLSASSLPAERQQHWRTLFAPLCRQLPEGPACRLHFRAAAFANAFALPGGEVVFTDPLVELLRSDAEFIAIAGHELGHVEGRHGLHGVVSSASLAFLFSAAVGDVGTVAFGGGFTSLQALLAAHSRAHERAADAYALHTLSAQGHDPAAFADIIERLARELPDSDQAAYLQSHPASADRAAAARTAAAHLPPRED